MNTMKYFWIVVAMAALSSSCWAMGNKPQTLSPAVSGGGGGSFGNSDSGGDSGSLGSSAYDMMQRAAGNDAVQQMADDVGGAIGRVGQSLADDAYSRHFNQAATQANTNTMVNNATNVYAGGKTLQYAGKAAPHAGWVATTAGRAAESDYSGAAIQGVNGCGRTVFVSKTGGAVGIWAGAKLGAMGGAWAGPLGAGAGFIVGAGAAYLAGWGWDNTIGAGANAIDQRVADWNAHNQYAGQGNHSGGASGSWDYNPGSDQSLTGGGSYENPGVAGGTPNIGRDAARDSAQQSRQAAPRPKPPSTRICPGPRGR